ncbi:MAG: hypothetical protein ABI165_01315 [Bryobacteraceae bacterium]
MRDTFSARACSSFTHEEWVEHACGSLPSSRQAEVEAHIARCAECREKSEELLLVDRRLIAAATLLRESLPAVSPAASQAFEEWIRLAAATLDFVPRRLLRLELFLTPICGFRTAERAMLIAARHALVESVDLLTERHWAAFVKSLSALVGALCGEFAGDLLWRVGQTAA